MSLPDGSLKAVQGWEFQVDGVERRVPEPLSVPLYSENGGVTFRGKGKKTRRRTLLYQKSQRSESR